MNSPLPTDKQERKDTPLCRGLLDYFPNALAEIARVSLEGNRQHNGDEELHWARGKSTDHPDCIVRHLVDRGRRDTDGQRHSAKVAWRALAMLEEELEAEGAAPGRGSWFPEPAAPECEHPWTYRWPGENRKCGVCEHGFGPAEIEGCVL